MAAEKQGSPTTTKKRTTGPPILPPINDNVSPCESNLCVATGTVICQAQTVLDWR